jgi:branched-chain amino acid transport system substrate-binding protein
VKTHKWKASPTLLRFGVVLSALSTMAMLCIGTATPSPAGASGSPITIGVVADLTGTSASTFADGPAAAQARVDLQNAQGGVNGHPIKLVVVDDESSQTDVVTATQDLVSNKGAFAILADSPWLGESTAAAYTLKAGVPVVSANPDGQPFTEQPYTNLFSWAGVGSPAVYNGLTYTTTVEAQFLKDIGVTKLAGLGYGLSISSVDSIKELFAAAKKLGIAQCYANYSVPFGTVNFSTEALQIKAAGCNGIAGSFVDSSDVGLSEAVKNDGIKAKQLYFTGYDSSVTSSPTAAAAFQGAYALASVNFTTPNPATQAMLAALVKYDPGFKKGEIPDLGAYGSYLAADLMIKGLQVAGKNPTRASFIKNLRKVDSYDAGGILPTAVSFRHVGGVAMLPKKPCSYFMQLQGRSWVVGDKGQAVCGTNLGVSGL